MVPFYVARNLEHEGSYRHAVIGTMPAVEEARDHAVLLVDCDDWMHGRCLAVDHYVAVQQCGGRCDDA